MEDNNITDNSSEQSSGPTREELMARIAELEGNKPQQAEPTNDKVKENISKAYEERDAMAKQVKDLQEEKRQAELRALEEAGKKEEADKMRMDELQRQLKDSNDRITTLTRDNSLRAELAGLDFISDKAAGVAYNDIVGSLIQDAAGNWVSSTGQTIRDYVQFYHNDEANRFLFKVKQSTGSSTMDAKTTSGPVSSNKSITEMTEAEMLEAAANGQLDGRSTWI